MDVGLGVGGGGGGGGSPAVFLDQELLHVAQARLPELHLNGPGRLGLQVCLSSYGLHCHWRKEWIEGTERERGKREIDRERDWKRCYLHMSSKGMTNSQRRTESVPNTRVANQTSKQL